MRRLSACLLALCLSGSVVCAENDFPILQLSQERHAHRHLTKYRGMLFSFKGRFPSSSMMTDSEKALLLKMASLQGFKGQEEGFELCRENGLSPHQCVAFSYRALLGIFEPTEPGVKRRHILRAIEEEIAEELEKKGFLIKHSYEGMSSSLVGADFRVKKGTGAWLKQEIEARVAQLGDRFLIEDSRSVSVLAGENDETVEWLYED